jgi:hypothetical protein
LEFDNYYVKKIISYLKKKFVEHITKEGVEEGVETK